MDLFHAKAQRKYNEDSQASFSFCPLSLPLSLSDFNTFAP